MSVSAHFAQPVRPQTVFVSSVGSLAAVIACADARGSSERLTPHQPGLRAA